MVTVGIDEVGRGSWAGPLVVGAVALAYPIVGLKDSKKLSKLQRTKLAKAIHESAMACSLGWVTSREVDNLGLTKAMGLAIRRAMKLINIDYTEIIIDGNYNYIPENLKARFLIAADSIEPSVSAASIIAKVARDNWMTKIAKLYPVYGFEKNVGYGTQQHIDAIKNNGICKLHRLSYKPLKKYFVNSV